MKRGATTALRAGALGLALLASHDAAAWQASAPSASAAGSGSATPASATPPALTVRAVPIFGTEAALGFGWQDIAVTLENGSTAGQKGTLELKSSVPYVERNAFIARAPYNVPAGRSAVLRMPTHGIQEQMPTVILSVQDDKGKEVQSVTITVNMAQSPTLIDVDNPSRMGMVLRGWPASVSYSLTPSYTYTYGATAPTMNIAVGAPQYDRATGDPILPTRAAAYSGVTVLFIHSDTLVRLEPEQKDALMAWVAGGGTLAVALARPEDLHSAEIETLAGTGVTTTAAPPSLLSLPVVPRAFAPPPSPFGTAPPPMDDFEEKYDPRLDDRGPAFIPIRTSPIGAGGGTGPADGVKGKLQGFTGGRTVPSNWGAGATYGAGQVQLLAFDPSAAPGLDDPWSQSRMVDLVNRSWDRRASLVFPAGMRERRTYTYWGGSSSGSDEIRKALDPNEGFRPALGFAAILLVLYSIVVGPLNFLRAAKKGKPLRALLWAPIFSGLAFGAIVATGLVVKGFRGRARHLSLVETSSGSTHGAICRFRGFYTSETRSLSVGATDRSSIIEVESSDSVMDDKATLRIDRNGLSLENITSLPWQTLVIRENGGTELKGTLDVKTVGPSVEVTNHLGATLLDAMVYVPGDGIRYFAEIKDGETVVASVGTFLLGAASRRAVGAGGTSVHPLDEAVLAGALPRKDHQRVEKTWAPLAATAGDGIDWWPDDAAVVLGEIEGGEKLKSDSGLSVESDRLMVRVVGASPAAPVAPAPTGGTP